MIRLLPLTAEQAPRLADLEALLFAEDSPWPEWQFAAELASPHNYYIGAFAADLLVGYAGLGAAGDDFEVHTIGVDPAWQGKGIGRLLMAALLDRAGSAAIFLEVRTDNNPAIALYRSLGFVTLGVRPHYYQPSGADAFVMRRAEQEEETHDCAGN